jgi:predicted ATPase/transcriptional regulator with XRE-family HTH domain
MISLSRSREHRLGGSMDTVESHAFGALLKRYRLAAGLTQETLAEQAGLSSRGLSDLERGARRIPRLETIHLLAGALRLSARERAIFLAAARPADQRGVATTGRETQDEAASPGEALGAPPEGTSVPAGVLTPFAGRLPELALLQRHLGGVGPPVLLLAGEPGIGKTRLLQEAARQAVARGLAVLTGGCQRQRGQQPYAPLLDALDHHIQSQPALQLRSDLRGCAWLVRLLPELADGSIEPLPAGTLPPEQERRLLFAAVRRFLQNLAGPAGTLLLLDDLQWAGNDALALLATLVRAAGSIPLRVVGAYRDTEVGPDQPLGILLADLAQASLATQHSLRPLAQAEAAQLLDALLADLADPEGRLRERVLQRTGGMPFFLISCAQGLRTQGTGQGSAVVPWDVAQGVRQRAALLPQAGQEVLGVAAVVGRRALRALLVGVAGQLEEAVLAGLEAACRARLLLEEGDAAYTFAHDVIREVVEADLGMARRTVLHRKVAEALERDQAGASPETLAYHYERGGNPDKAVLYLERAGDHAWARRAHAAAEGYYHEAIDRLAGLGRV